MSAIVPYGVVYPKKYHSDRQAAAEIAKQLGFKEDTFIEVTVQWGDQDPNAHLNNAIITRKLDAPTAQAINQGSKGRGLVVGQVMNRFERPVYAPDHLLIAHRATQVAQKKIILSSVIVSFDQRAKVCSGKAIMVGFDYDHHKGAELPNGLYSLIEQEIDDAAKMIGGAQGLKAKL
ncbi:BQ2448_635 [Microbotryum intermedium]|uniref:BQ2448_635 protein n=1 Tax=Microbotryum intermedium TaxID=269621 RepID=A0A238F9H6_9BASI|nr:BQ2448_635 [Microbotryum intermedium]